MHAFIYIIHIQYFHLALYILTLLQYKGNTKLPLKIQYYN